MNYRSFLFITEKGSDLYKLRECLEVIQHSDKPSLRILTVHSLQNFTDACALMIDTIGVQFNQLIKSLDDKGQVALLYPIYTLAFSEDRDHLFLYTGANCEIGEFVATGKGPCAYVGWSPHGLPMGFLIDYYSRRAMDNFSSGNKRWLNGFNS